MHLISKFFKSVLSSSSTPVQWRVLERPAQSSMIRDRIDRLDYCDKNYTADLAGMKGMQLAFEGSFESAIDPLSRGIAYNQNDINLLSWRGMAFIARSRQALAIADFNRALSISPDLRLARLGIAISVILVDPLLAISITDKLLSENSRDEHVLLCHSIAYGVRGDRQTSLQKLRLLLEINPNNQAALGVLALERLPLIDFDPTARDDVIWAIDRALKINPNNPMARVADSKLRGKALNIQRPTPYCDMDVGVFYLPLAWRDPLLSVRPC
jgi:tetratricopeptide (TPR) repeat protein